MTPLFRRVFLAAVLVGGGAVADEDHDYLEACLAAAGGRTNAARVTCFGQVSELCLAGTAGTTADMVGCANREFAAWSGLLERAYADVRATQPDARLAVVMRAQEAWIVWRDARCSVYTTFEGSLARPLATLCLAETTARRVSDLWSIDRGLIGETDR